jgi:nitrite reductase/ring-hydroxylating ferredoxin subunit
MRIDDTDVVTVAPDGKPLEEQPRWRQDFPIDWPQDEYRSRRDFARFLLLTSFAFAAGQGWIVLLDARRRAEGKTSVQEIAAVSDLKIGEARLFDYPRKGEACVLVRVSEKDFVAYNQKCTHLSCPVLPKHEEGKFHCPCHEGSFDMRTGQPLAGPPRRPLPRVKVDVRDGRVYALGVEEQR